MFLHLEKLSFCTYSEAVLVALGIRGTDGGHGAEEAHNTGATGQGGRREESMSE